VPGTRTTAAIGERTGPSDNSIPETPSLPVTAIAAACPLGISIMKATMPLQGKWICSAGCPECTSTASRSSGTFRKGPSDSRAAFGSAANSRLPRAIACRISGKLLFPTPDRITRLHMQQLPLSRRDPAGSLRTPADLPHAPDLNGALACSENGLLTSEFIKDRGGWHGTSG
jgi:hypothetical protein